MNKITLTALTVFLLLGCTQSKKEKNLTEGGMKCGAGKCGATMVSGSDILVKKKMNMLDQMDKNDSRRECVTKAESTKKLYDCVRDKKSGRLVK